LIGLSFVDETVTSHRVRLLDTLRVRRLVRVAQALEHDLWQFDAETGLFEVSRKRLKGSESLNVSSSFRAFQSTNKS
jgi:hypothetical protein